jgi:hypothetical protein
MANGKQQGKKERNAEEDAKQMIFVEVAET